MVHKNKAGQASYSISESEVENVSNKTDNSRTSSKEDFAVRLGTSKGVVMSQTESHGLVNDDVISEIETGNDVLNSDNAGKVLTQEFSTALQKSGIQNQDGGSSLHNERLDTQRNVSCDDKMLNDSKGNNNEGETSNHVGIKQEELVSNKKQVDSLSARNLWKL